MATPETLMKTLALLLLAGVPESAPRPAPPSPLV